MPWPGPRHDRRRPLREARLLPVRRGQGRDPVRAPRPSVRAARGRRLARSRAPAGVRGAHPGGGDRRPGGVRAPRGCGLVQRPPRYSGLVRFEEPMTGGVALPTTDGEGLGGDRLSLGVAARLSRYLQVLTQAKKMGKETISSQELADYTHVNSTQIRRDLSGFGKFGKRGVGYNVDAL